jgi:23S rRNA pseudouridine2605 synthase
MMLEGRVRVNGRTVTELGTKADPDVDSIDLDGKPLRSARHKVYILMNKPRGIICAASDPEGKPVVTDLVTGLEKTGIRLFPVGRLDFDSEGALILTNDGELTNKLIHPRYGVQKKYLVKVRDVPDENDIEKLRRGVSLEDGRTLPALARLVCKTKENSWVEVVVTEGRNRLVKRMCEAIGHPVSKLKRTSFAGMGVKGLKPGAYRSLTEKEVWKLQHMEEIAKKTVPAFKRVAKSTYVEKERGPKSLGRPDKKREFNKEGAPGGPGGSRKRVFHESGKGPKTFGRPRRPGGPGRPARPRFGERAEGAAGERFGAKPGAKKHFGNRPGHKGKRPHGFAKPEGGRRG